MAIDEQTLAAIRDELERNDRLDARAIDVTTEGDALVLRGAVPTDEEASVAALLAEHHVQNVRNRLRVDPNLREDPTGSLVDRDVGAGDAQDSSTDVSEALEENIPWDPPDEPSMPPTQAEQRGVTDRDAQVEPAAPEGATEDPDAVQPSAADLSQSELARSARPSADGNQEERDHG